MRALNFLSFQEFPANLLMCYFWGTNIDTEGQSKSTFSSFDIFAASCKVKYKHIIFHDCINTRLKYILSPILPFWDLENSMNKK